MSRTVLLAVSLLKIGLRLAMSEIEPSTRWPPLTTFCVVVVLVPPPQAARNSMPPVRKAVKARAPPMPRRTSRRDQSCRKRSNCSDSRSELLLLLTYILHDVIAALRLVRIMQGTSLPDKSLRFAPRSNPQKAQRRRGSNASLTAFPNRLAANTVMKIHTPGRNTSQIECVKYCWALLSMLPQLGVGG